MNQPKILIEVNGNYQVGKVYTGVYRNIDGNKKVIFNDGLKATLVHADEDIVIGEVIEVKVLRIFACGGVEVEQL